MTRSKVVGNRKGKNGGCRNFNHAYIMASIQHDKEFFMSARDMCLYWNEPIAPLYGQLELMSRWLRALHNKSKRMNHANY